jgi:hypothetical protein
VYQPAEGPAAVIDACSGVPCCATWPHLRCISGCCSVCSLQLHQLPLALFKNLPPFCNSSCRFCYGKKPYVLQEHVQGVPLTLLVSQQAALCGPVNQRCQAPYPIASCSRLCSGLGVDIMHMMHIDLYGLASVCGWRHHDQRVDASLQFVWCCLPRGQCVSRSHAHV